MTTALPQHPTPHPVTMKKPEKPDKPAHGKIDVTITYAGLTKPFTVKPDQTVQSLLALALTTFCVHTNPHTQSLFSTKGELADAQTLAAAAVVDGDHLLLRPSEVKGGQSRGSNYSVTSCARRRPVTWVAA